MKYENMLPGYFFIFVIVICLGLCSSVWADQCDSGATVRAYVYSIPGIKPHISTGATGSNICIFQDVSASMASGGTSIGQGFVDGIVNGAPGAHVSTTGDELGCPDGKDWSLLCMGLQQAINECCSAGCNLVVVSDGCSNHRNPFLAKEDQECFDSLMGQLNNSSSTNLIAAQVNPSNMTPGSVNGNTNFGPWTSTTPATQLQSAALYVLTLASQH